MQLLVDGVLCCVHGGRQTRLPVTCLQAEPVDASNLTSSFLAHQVRQDF